jgi:hypothetical protein
MAKATYRGVSYDTEIYHQQNQTQNQNFDLNYRGIHYNTQVQQHQQPQQCNLNYRGIKYVKEIN